MIINLSKFKKAKMHKESEKKDTGKSISDILNINNKTNQTSLNDLTTNDGSEDPGSQLVTEYCQY